MTKRDIVAMYEEAKEKVLTERNSGRFRNPRKEEYMERIIHEGTFAYLLENADKKMTLEIIDSIACEAFAENNNHITIEINVLKDIIRDNINDKDIISASFNAMETVLKNTTNDILNGDRNKAMTKVASMQKVLNTISDLRDNYPNKLGKQTDAIHETYKEMMKECFSKGLYNETLAESYPTVRDYYHGYNVYEETIELEKERRQTDAAWETKEQIDAAKQRIYNRFTQREVAEYEKSHAEKVQKEDAAYISELKEFISEHENISLSNEHRKQVTEIRAKHGDRELSAAYENYKDVARNPDKGDKTEEKPASHKVPKRAVFLARAESKRQA